MPSVNQNVKMWAGDSLTLRVPVLNKDGTAPALTGSTARWWMGKAVNSTGADVYVQKATGGSGITMTLETVGGVANVPVFYVAIQPGNTLSLAPTSDPAGPFYYHELEVVDSNGNVSTVMTGRFDLQAALVV